MQFIVDLKWRGSGTTQTTDTSNLTQQPIFLVTQSNRLEKVVVDAQVTGKVVSSVGPVSNLTGTLRSAANGSRQFLLGAGRQTPSQLTRSVYEH